MSLKLFWRKKKYINQYNTEEREYMRKYKIHIILELFNYSKSIYVISVEQLKRIIGEKFPKAQWIIKEYDQIVYMFEQMGCNFDLNEYDEIIFNAQKMYCDIIQSHVAYYGPTIYEELTAICEKTNGRATYWQLISVLQLANYNFAQNDKNAIKTCILLFLKQMNLLFNYDGEYVYFP